MKVVLTQQGRAMRAKTRTLAEAIYTKAGNAGMTVDDLAETNMRIKALRDAFRAP